MCIVVLTRFLKASLRLFNLIFLKSLNLKLLFSLKCWSNVFYLYVDCQYNVRVHCSIHQSAVVYSLSDFGSNSNTSILKVFKIVVF